MSEKQPVKIIDVLLVDDNDDDIEIALRTFKKSKTQNRIHVVHDGQEALAFLRHESGFSDEEEHPTPNVILLDISMPKMNGFEFLAAVKKDPLYAYIPVLMLTSSRNEKDVLASFRAGAAGYISKPVSGEDFTGIVDALNDFWRLTRLPQKQNSARTV